MLISVRELKDHLSEYLHRAQGGEEIVVTSHNRPVARLSPPKTTGEKPGAAAVERLRAQPWVRSGSGEKPTLPRPLIHIKPGEKTVAEIVREQRD